MSLDSKTADYYLQKAKNRIEEIGQWGLMLRYEQVANLIGEHINRIDITGLYLNGMPIKKTYYFGKASKTESTFYSE
jgi:hypothetical protein